MFLWDHFTEDICGEGVEKKPKMSRVCFSQKDLEKIVSTFHAVENDGYDIRRGTFSIELSD